MKSIFVVGGFWKLIRYNNTHESKKLRKQAIE